PPGPAGGGRRSRQPDEDHHLHHEGRGHPGRRAGAQRGVPGGTPGQHLDRGCEPVPPGFYDRGRGRGGGLTRTRRRGSPMGKLDGKVALATGSGRNIGRATVLKLAAEGASVVVNARSNNDEAEAVANEARALGVKALAVIADVARRDQVDRMVAATLTEFGRVDILVNNAAIRPHKPFTELTIEDWEEVRGVVLDGPLYLTRALIQPMVDNRYGRILFFTGEGAFVGGAKRAHVSAAKMGLVGLARSLAVEFAPHNIRVNVVSPGVIDTSRANPE